VLCRIRGDEHETAEREAAAECSSSRALGEYAVSARSDIRSTASLPQGLFRRNKKEALGLMPSASFLFLPPPVTHM